MKPGRFVGAGWHTGRCVHIYRSINFTAYIYRLNPLRRINSCQATLAWAVSHTQAACKHMEEAC